MSKQSKRARRERRERIRDLEYKAAREGGFLAMSYVDRSVTDSPTQSMQTPFLGDGDSDVSTSESESGAGCGCFGWLFGRR